ncbi:MAG: hypothetical protein H6719_20460 [Sandaracinaceae bacterium]|nr:hypothetical protein [Sandaracinaceae bacterium]
MPARLRWVGLLGLLAGCTAQYPDVLEDGFFVCSTPEDCGPDQGCAEGNVYSADFCRPACDRDDPSTCPGGVCTVSGACLDGCTIDEDGNASDCPGEDFTCVRIDAFRDEGVCYPVEPCSRTADCTRDGVVPQLCLNEAVGLPSTTVSVGLRFDNLYCTAAADRDGRCPTGYLSFGVSDEAGRPQNVCFPPCTLGADGPFCPPATTCFRGFGELVGLPNTPPCLPGFWGMPCQDDTHCLVGRCLPVGNGARACTETCADADAMLGGCRELEQIGAIFGVATRMTCEDIRGVDTCVPRYDLLSLCDNQLECAGGTDVACALVGLGDDTQAHVCLRLCATDDECAEGTGGTGNDYRCAPTPSGVNICTRRRGLGARCNADADCAEGRCCDLGGFGACLTTCT